jgi:ubiquinone/menaquinone biosynthesis C-methylase UbiE
MGHDPDEVKKQYDMLAKEYAEAFAGEHGKKPKDREMLRRFSLEVGKGRPVWDLGCGPGQTAKYLKDLGVEISGMDLSEKMLEQAGTRCPGIPFRKGNLLDLEFENDSVAGVVSFYAIVHFTKEQVETAFREVLRVLRPGGLFLLAYHVGEGTIHVEEFLGKKTDLDFIFFPTDFITGCLKKTGFAGIEVIEREPYPGVEYPSRRAYVFAAKPLP